MSERKVWLCYVRGFDMKPKPQIVWDNIPSSLEKDIAWKLEISESKANVYSIGELARLFPIPGAA